MEMAPTPVQHIEIRNGKAYIAGTGLKPEIVAAAHVKAGMSVAEIAEQYEIPPADVHAALSYYYDHEEEIERQFAEAEALVRQVGTSTQDLIAKLRARQQAAKPD
jgi:uncharacterized protein (DUF433 family)